MSDADETVAGTPPPEALGTQLRRLRSLTSDSLRRVADATGYSTAYLVKLERGEVKAPSPHLLRGLARHYDVSYLSLMALAGYETSDAHTARDTAQEEAALIADALTSDRFSSQEREAIAAFISSLKSRDQGRI